MAVEARFNPFPPRLLGDRDLMMMNCIDGMGDGCAIPMGYGVMTPLSGASTATVAPMYGTAACENFPASAGSSLTCAVPTSRKRYRDSAISSVESGVTGGELLSFLGEDFSLQFQQQQLEIDRFVAIHTERIRLEIESRRRRASRRIAAAVVENVMRKLKAKEEEIEKMGKLNWALEERVKSLSLESQIWKDLAQTNEATANALRCNLQQVLAQVHDGAGDDAESCCGSTAEESPAGDINRLCQSCRKMESCVLLLPCRHLCLCTVCGSSLNTCPICNTAKTASIHVNLSGE